MSGTMFAIHVIERDPPGLGDILPGLAVWLQVVGGFTAFGVVLWMVIGLPAMRRSDWAALPRWRVPLFVTAVAVAAVCYLAAFPFLVILPTAFNREPAVFGVRVGDILMTVGGAAAIVAGWTPFALGLTRLRFRRIFALAKLSFLEALRRRVLWAFAAILLVFLFGSWFVPYKSEDQVRVYVGLVYGVMAVLLLAASMILAAFSLPTDMRLQTIHTVVTKPVERFEIVLGRFLGFAALMTLVLAAMAGLSLLYVVRGVTPEASAESLKARVPLYGELTFEGTGSADKGESVGREWDYRSHISGPMPGAPTQFAVWSLPEVPASLGNRKAVRCEYSFDVYRTTKGEENRGVSCAFTFQTWRFRKGQEKEYHRERDEERRKGAGRLSDREIDDKLAEKYGYFEVPAARVVDYHTLAFDIPAGLFRNATAADPDRKKELEQRGQGSAPALQVRVKCISLTQYVGMAKYDYYLRADDPQSGNEGLWFGWNFLKGALGLWCLMCLVIALAVALSTYLSGVISLIVTAVLLVCGLGQEFIAEVATGRQGGPMDAMAQVVGGRPMAAPPEDTTGNRIGAGMDMGFRWAMRRWLDVLPDVERFDFSDQVAEGFNVGGVQLLLTLLLLTGYVLPWLVMAYYLLRWREVAGNM